jgi:dTDP-4-dehydrorhamnose 3,5-epimerase
VRFEATSLEGVWLVHTERLTDERGFFSRTWCVEEFSQHGLNPHISQCSISFNQIAGTVRGMHYQASPHSEAKLVRCTSGCIFDVVVDLRPNSETYLKHLGLQLSASDRTALYIPEGMAHGFQTLLDASEIFYQISTPFHPESSRGVRWNDPQLQITWPLPITNISEKDRTFPDLVVAGDHR